MIQEIILIDDDEITLMICEFVFVKNGFTRKTTKATNGEEGIELLNNMVAQKMQDKNWQPPALLFLDLNMPVMNGWDFLDEFQEYYRIHFPDLKIIILSSTINPEDYQRSIAYHEIIDFISKPLTDEAIAKLKSHPELQAHFQD